MAKGLNKTDIFNFQLITLGNAIKNRQNWIESVFMRFRFLCAQTSFVFPLLSRFRSFYASIPNAQPLFALLILIPPVFHALSLLLCSRYFCASKPCSLPFFSLPLFMHSTFFCFPAPFALPHLNALPFSLRFSCAPASFAFLNMQTN